MLPMSVDRYALLAPKYHSADLMVYAGRKRKIKCNREYPCLPCNLRGEGTLCREVDAAQSSPPPIITLSALHARLLAVEEQIRVHLDEVKRSSAQSCGEAESSTKRPEKRKRSTGSEAEGLSAEGGDDNDEGDEDAATMLENFAIPGADIVEEIRIPGSPTGVALPFKETSTIDLLSHMAFLVEPGTDVVGRILRHLPPQATTEKLLTFYFGRLDWYTKVVHAPSFSADSKALYQMLNEGRTRGIRLNFLSLQFAVLSLSYRLLERDERQQLALSLDQTLASAQICYSATRALLQYNNWVGNHSLENLQTLITHWSLLGSCIKTAQNLGLSRLGSEDPGRKWPPAWRSQIRREVGRRVWWALVSIAELDSCLLTGSRRLVASIFASHGIFNARPLTEYSDDHDSVPAMERTVAMITGHNRRLRLYRPVLLQGRSSPHFDFTVLWIHIRHHPVRRSSVLLRQEQDTGRSKASRATRGSRSLEVDAEAASGHNATADLAFPGSGGPPSLRVLAKQLLSNLEVTKEAVLHDSLDPTAEDLETLLADLFGSTASYQVDEHGEHVGSNTPLS
ncbi:hypothetical protein IAR55_006000 [Kwoniella newhampshirensis]|uniref:Transcription factor domain-containing protein n=1 Tax=Kwoniella newhampshirensis TaxID=1651941 RepID=A0AAW0YTS6_9TREE